MNLPQLQDDIADDVFAGGPDRPRELSPEEECGWRELEYRHAQLNRSEQHEFMPDRNPANRIARYLTPAEHGLRYYGQPSIVARW